MNWKKTLVIVWVVGLLLCIILSGNDSSSSNKGMTKLERDNARWAHEAYEYINGLD